MTALYCTYMIDYIIIRQKVKKTIRSRKIVLPKYVEIGTLATVLSWGLGSTNMPSTALVTTGLILNKTVSEGDKFWGQLGQDLSVPANLRGLRSQDGARVLPCAGCVRSTRLLPRQGVCMLAGKDCRVPVYWLVLSIPEGVAGWVGAVPGYRDGRK